MPEGSAPVRDNSKLYIPGAILLGAVIIGVALIIGLSHGAGGNSTAGSGAGLPSAAVNIKDVKLAGEPYVGNPNAPVTMASWEDYQCPFCKQFETATLPSLMTKYVNTGKLRIVFKDFEFLGSDSTADGQYARAVWDLYPDKFFAWRMAIFKQQPQENSLSAADNKAHLEKITAEIPGLDVRKIETQIAANKAKYDAAMDADKQEGENFGINGTPGFIVGTTFIGGAEPLATFTSAIDAQLK